jgi:hypothetical protein
MVDHDVVNDVVNASPIILLSRANCSFFEQWLGS